MKPATTVTKVCRVLAELKGRPSLGLTDIARRTDLLPSDVHRILTSLQAYGYVEQDQHTKRYAIGYELLRVGLSTLQRNSLQKKGLPILFRLSDDCEATAHLAMFDRRRSEVVLVGQVELAGERVFEGGLGEAKPAHCTALGKAVMANLDTEARTLALERCGLAKSTSHTITNKRDLERELQQIHLLGYAIDREETTEFACCLGSPIADCTGAAVGAISVTMSAKRFSMCHQVLLANQVKSAAAAVSAALGFAQ
jgi:IclR family transcriptional regulator, KDG regulon repressor